VKENDRTEHAHSSAAAAAVLALPDAGIVGTALAHQNEGDDATGGTATNKATQSRSGPGGYRHRGAGHRPRRQPRRGRQRWRLGLRTSAAGALAQARSRFARTGTRVQGGCTDDD